MRAAKAASPAGCMRPAAVSTSTRAMFTELQIKPGRRGVKRIGYASSSMRLRTPSIQPKHRASSTDSDHVMLGRPESTFQ